MTIIIQHDFGMTRRQAERRFRRLLHLDALHEANIKSNPLPYLERASERIHQLERALLEAADAARGKIGEPPSLTSVVLTKAEYERLCACRDIVEDAVAVITEEDDLP